MRIEAPDLLGVRAIKRVVCRIAHARAHVNVYNLADETYIDRVSGGHFVPGAGRTVALTVGVTL